MTFTLTFAYSLAKYAKSNLCFYQIFSTRYHKMLSITVSGISKFWHLVSRCLLKLCIWKGAFGICTQRAVLQLSSALSWEDWEGIKHDKFIWQKIWHESIWHDDNRIRFTASLAFWNILVVHRLHSKIMEYHSISRPTAWIHLLIKASGGPWRNTKDNSMGWDPQETNNTVLQCNQTLSSSDNPHGPGLSKWFTWSMPIYQSTQELRQSATSPTSCLDKTRYLKGDRCALRILWVRFWHCQASWRGGRPSDHSFQRIQHMRTTCYKNQHERGPIRFEYSNQLLRQ